MYVTVPSDFAGLSNVTPVLPVFRDMAGKGQRRSLAEEQVLFHEGDRATSLYEIVSGVLRLTRYTESGRRQVIAFGYPGDIVGFPDRGRYRTECDVVSAGEVVVYKSAALDNPESDPALHHKLVDAALAEISCMQDHFLMLGRKSASEKTASFLGVLMSRVGERTPDGLMITLPMNRADIADFLGLTTETVCRTFSQLRAARVIALKGAQRVLVLKPDALLAMAERD